MDRRRKCVLTKLKTLVNLLDEEESRRTNRVGDTESFNANILVSREEEPTCPAMNIKCPTTKEIIPFQSTLRSKVYPLVPYCEKFVDSPFKVHACSPSTTFCMEPIQICNGAIQRTLNTPPGIPYSFQQIHKSGTGHRKVMKKSPKLYIVDENESCTSYANQLPKLEYCGDGFFGNQMRIAMKRPLSSYPPPRCTQSKELRGGIMHLGCDCDKTNGLQDRCARFCCISNPKCKHRPAACYLSRFSGGKHLPDISDQMETVPTYVDYRGSDSLEFFDTNEGVIASPYLQEDSHPKIYRAAISNKYHPYNYNIHCEVPTENIHEPVCYVPVVPKYFENSCRSFQPSEKNQRSNYCAGKKVLRIPRVVYDSPSEKYDLSPTKVCVVCPLSHLESTCECPVDW